EPGAVGREGARPLSRRGADALAAARRGRADRGRGAPSRAARRPGRGRRISRPPVAAGPVARGLRRRRHRADAAHAAGLRPQLLFHLDLHGRSAALARRAARLNAARLTIGGAQAIASARPASRRKAVAARATSAADTQRASSSATWWKRWMPNTPATSG